MLSITQVSDVDILELYQLSHRENWESTVQVVMMI